MCFHILITTWQLTVWEAISNFSLENVVPITHEQTIICSKTHLDGTTHEQTIICKQLFAGHVVGCRPMEGKKKLHRMITSVKVSSVVVTCEVFSEFLLQFKSSVISLLRLFLGQPFIKFPDGIHGFWF